MCSKMTHSVGATTAAAVYAKLGSNTDTTRVAPSLLLLYVSRAAVDYLRMQDSLISLGQKN